MQGKTLQDFVIDRIDDLKGRDIIALDVQGKSSITDCMIVCTSTSSRHAVSIADHVVQKSRAAGLLSLGIEGKNSADWIVMDLSDVIVHVMQKENRHLYGLEELWGWCVKLQLAAVGARVPDWVQTSFTEYLRRFPRDMPSELIEIPAGKRGKNVDIKRILDKEGEQMLAAAGRNRIITLDIPGKPWDTPQLAAELERWKLDGRDVNLLIGGPEGLSPACRTAAKQSWSLSALTLPHPLIRVLVTGSLYRAWSTITSHPYHRGW